MTTQTQLAVGDIAPDFLLTDAEGRTVSKADFAGRSVILYFYPKAASPGCTIEACDFRDNLSALSAAGFEVLGISPDDTDSLREFAAEEGLTFSLLSDEGAAVARAYGSFGPKTIGEHTVLGTQRSTFVIGPDGTLTHAEYDVDARGHVARLRTQLLP
ncbi:peroxiredoxin [Brevibacterium spongiae]|uniref:thioredoxin-dependent peroxiredoxin n=1 Tax=Brevibacterium spongiae TaxID=2909672 RepID=A0ABY5SRW1_9MICO|nr:peroxiredoxin [Brevibacterium spongiae]UVI36929.1 peroxiredoxin [Brevibacterium spongiae]